MFTKELELLEAHEQDRQLLEIEYEKFFADSKWSVENPGRPEQLITANGLKMTRHAFNSMADLLNHFLRKKLHVPYMWEHPDVIELCMPQHIEEFVESRMRSAYKKNRHTNYKMMLHNDTITGFFSTHYVDYSNLTLLKEYIKSIDALGLIAEEHFINIEPYGDVLKLIAIFDTFPQDYSIYGTGVEFTNSQNGSISLIIRPIVKSNACNNSITSFLTRRRRHSTGIENFATEQMEALPQHIELGTITYHNYMDATKIPVVDMSNILEYIRIRKHLTRNHHKLLVKGLESERKDIDNTLFNLVSGLTYVAQHMPKLAEETMLDYSAKVLQYGVTLDEDFTLEALREVDGTQLKL